MYTTARSARGVDTGYAFRYLDSVLSVSGLVEVEEVLWVE